MAHDIMQVVDVTLSIFAVVFVLAIGIWCWEEWESNRQKQRDREP